MTDPIIEVGLQAGVIALIAVIIALFAPKSFRIFWLLFALALIIVHDAFLLRIYGLIPSLAPASHWNWTGKILATVVMLSVASLPLIGWRNSGIILRQAAKSGPAWIVFAILTSAIFVAAIYTGNGHDDLDTIFFQWTMPGIEEEIFYRGVLLFVLNEVFTSKIKLFGAQFGWGGVLATVAFGLIHSLFYGVEGVSFNLVPFLLTGGPSILLLWFRERTGSIVLPVLAHNAVNGAFHLF